MFRQCAFIAKLSAAFMSQTNSAHHTRYLNLITLTSFLLDEGYLEELLLRNVKKLNAGQELSQSQIKECELVKAILHSQRNIQEKPQLLNEIFTLSKNLLKSRTNESYKISFRMLGVLITLVQPNSYAKIERLVLAEITKQQDSDHCFNNVNCLKFLQTYLRHLELNSPGTQSLLQFADSFLTIVVFNLKNRNTKAREASKKIILSLFSAFKGADLI